MIEIIFGYRKISYIFFCIYQLVIVNLNLFYSPHNLILSFMVSIPDYFFRKKKSTVTHLCVSFLFLRHSSPFNQYRELF